jgi:hypothetical protein
MRELAPLSTALWHFGRYIIEPRLFLEFSRAGVEGHSKVLDCLVYTVNGDTWTAFLQYYKKRISSRSTMLPDRTYTTYILCHYFKQYNQFDWLLSASNFYQTTLSLTLDFFGLSIL